MRVAPSPLRIGAICQGISISADQPFSSSDTACDQLPSQSPLNWVSLLIVLSAMSSDSATMKLYPLRPSPSKST